MGASADKKTCDCKRGLKPRLDNCGAQLQQRPRATAMMLKAPERRRSLSSFESGRARPVKALQRGACNLALSRCF